MVIEAAPDYEVLLRDLAVDDQLVHLNGRDLAVNRRNHDHSSA